MSLKWSPNWLLLFTVILFMTAFVMFVVSQRNQLGLKKCVYGGEYYSSGEAIPTNQNCVCDKNGKLVCEDFYPHVSGFDLSSYTSEGLLFSYRFQNLIENSKSGPEVRFSEITTKDNGLRIIVERSSLCGPLGQLPPQMGYYMVQENELYLTISTNLLAGGFNQECIVSATYSIDGLFSPSESFKIFFSTNSDNHRTTKLDCLFDNF